jgi:hypothetical protein
MPRSQKAMLEDSNEKFKMLDSPLSPPASTSNAEIQRKLANFLRNTRKVKKHATSALQQSAARQREQFDHRTRCE